MNAPHPRLKQSPAWLESLLEKAALFSPQLGIRIIFGDDFKTHNDFFRHTVQAIQTHLRKTPFEAATWASDITPRDSRALSDGIERQLHAPESLPIELRYNQLRRREIQERAWFGKIETTATTTRGLIILPSRSFSYGTLFQMVGLEDLSSLDIQKNAAPVVAAHELGHLLNGAKSLGQISRKNDEAMADAWIKEIFPDDSPTHHDFRILFGYVRPPSVGARMAWNWLSLPSRSLNEDKKEMLAVWELKARAAHKVRGTPFSSLGKSLQDVGQGQGLADFYNEMTSCEKIALLQALPGLVEADCFSLPDTRELATQTLAAAQRFMPKLMA